MSRCFPYPPPGYSEKVGNEALVESIKLKMETERVAKEQMKKEKRKGKKGKGKGKRKRKEKKDETRDYTGKNWVEPKSGCFSKVKEAETEQREKSSLTEEHGQPIYLCLPSSPSDSTGNSNKRKRHSSPLVGSHNRGNIIRIRLLPPKKPKEDDIAVRTGILAENNNEVTIGASREINFSTKENSYIGAPIGTVKEPVCSTSGRDEAAAAAAAAAHGKARTSSGHDTVMTTMQKVELEYRSLFENWVPPKLQAHDDEEWLFQGRNQDVRVERQLKAFSDPISCSNTSVLGPCAQYLHEADVYALPFTVPF